MPPSIISPSYIGSLFVVISSFFLIIAPIPRSTLSRSLRSSSPSTIFVCFHSSYYQKTSYFCVSSPIFYHHSMTSTSVTSFPVASSNIKYISNNLRSFSSNQTLSPFKVNFKHYIRKNTSKFNFNFNPFTRQFEF